MSLSFFAGRFVFASCRALRVLFIGSGLFFLLLAGAAAQSSDEYFRQARKIAFDQKNYPAAIRLCQQALKKSPDYLDIRIFLGRLYYWNDQTDSSLLVLQQAFRQKPDYEDAARALADVTYFEKDYNQALHYSHQGLKYHPGSQSLALRKAKSLTALNRSQEAFAFTDSLLQLNPANEQLRSLASQLREFSFKSKIGLSYDYTYFDRQFANPWHLAAIDYSRQTKRGAVSGRLHYTNRFASSGWQLEADAYPRISKTFYAYTGIGYSPDMPVFPKFRAGVSVYANLPRAFEAEGGFRYLSFRSSTWLYTVSVGKYFKKFWFNARTYVSPGSSNYSQSYALTTRYYLKGADEYLALTLGRGFSPDDRIQAVRLNPAQQLITSRIGGTYRFVVAKRHILTLNTSFETGEYSPEKRGSQLNISTGYSLRF